MLWLLLVTKDAIFVIDTSQSFQWKTVANGIKNVKYTNLTAIRGKVKCNGSKLNLGFFKLDVDSTENMADISSGVARFLLAIAAGSHTRCQQK